MTLVAGREVADHGIPHREALTAMGLGHRWIDQQWLAQVLWYGLERAAGLGGVAIVNALLIAATYASAMTAARRLGASARSVFVVAFVALFAAPWSWQIRAQTFALPLFVWTLYLAATHARRPSRRILVAVPLLVLWANLHGSALLGAALVSLSAALVAARRRTRLALGEALAYICLSWLAVGATPYDLDILRYYHLLLIDPPFGDAIVEWQRSTPAPLTAVFYTIAAAAAILVVRHRRRLALFDLAALALLFAGAVQAVRGITWFALAVVVLVPAALDGALRRPDLVRYRRLNILIAGVSAAAVVVTLGVVATKPRSWFEKRWPTAALSAVERAARGGRVFASDRHADWLLWHLPSLRGRVAYDVRFELYTKAQFRGLARWDNRYGIAWMRVADGYPVVVVDEDSERSQTAALLRQPGTRAVYRDSQITVIERSR